MGCKGGGIVAAGVLPRHRGIYFHKHANHHEPDVEIVVTQPIERIEHRLTRRLRAEYSADLLPLEGQEKNEQNHDKKQTGENAPEKFGYHDCNQPPRQREEEGYRKKAAHHGNVGGKSGNRKSPRLTSSHMS